MRTRITLIDRPLMGCWMDDAMAMLWEKQETPADFKTCVSQEEGNKKGGGAKNPKQNNLLRREREREREREG